MKVAILGSGKIGCDLLVKVMRSKYLECILMAGQREESEGLKFAKEKEVPTSAKSIDAVLKSDAQVVFDATSAKAHKVHASLLRDRLVVDMTPSHIGKMCVPILNLEECLKEKNVNLISCGAQATIPLISQLETPTYVEIVSSVASKSAGIGTRDNIDQYTQTTSDAITYFCKVRSKSIIIISPAQPPPIMHNTIFSQGAKKPNLTKIVKAMQKYVPGYQLTLEPTFENNRLTFMNEVLGQGDYLPPYAGNLDIINAAAITIAEAYAGEDKILEASRELRTSPMEALS